MVVVSLSQNCYTELRHLSTHYNRIMSDPLLIKTSLKRRVEFVVVCFYSSYYCFYCVLLLDNLFGIVGRPYTACSLLPVTMYKSMPREAYYLYI